MTIDVGAHRSSTSNLFRSDGRRDACDWAISAALSRPDIEALYNAYGAKWRYEFHKLKHLNGFFYDPRASSWLPPSCPASQGTVRSLGGLPAADQRWMGAIKALR